MNSDTKRIIAMVTIIVIVTVGLLVVFDNRFDEEKIVSQIDGLDYSITSSSNDAINVTFRFEVTIENYGEIREIEIPCSNIQNYLVVKNSTVPLLDDFNQLNNQNSYILNATYFNGNCDNETTVFRVSENIIDEIVVFVPFRMISGTYGFTWFNSLADEYLAVVINVDIFNGNSQIRIDFEADIEE